MTTEPKKVQISEEIERLLEQAVHGPLIAEYKNIAFRIYAERVLPPSPYTIDTVYGSLPPLHGRPGSGISNDELDAMIEVGKEENLRNIVEGMSEG